MPKPYPYDSIDLTPDQAERLYLLAAGIMGSEDVDDVTALNRALDRYCAVRQVPSLKQDDHPEYGWNFATILGAKGGPMFAKATPDGGLRVTFTTELSGAAEERRAALRRR